MNAEIKKHVDRRAIKNPFGNRKIDKVPSEEATQKILEASEKVPGADKPRERPGFKSRKV